MKKKTKRYKALSRYEQKDIDENEKQDIKINNNCCYVSGNNINVTGGFIALILLVGTVIYSNSFDCSLHFDDKNIFTNAVLRDDSKLIDWIELFPSRPIGIITFALNYYLHNLNLWGYHFVNLIIHLINSLLVWWLTIMTFSTPALKNKMISRHKSIVALFTGLLFVSHPLATQSVTYIAQRFTSLATMFYILSIILYVRGRLYEEKKYFLISFGGSVIFAVMGLLTKENAFTLPFAIALYEICFFKVGSLKINIHGRALSLIVIILSIFILIFFSTSSLKIFETVPPMQGYDYAISAKDYFLTQFKVIITYIRLLILPINQNLDHDFPVSKTLFEVSTMSSLFMLLVVLTIGLLAFRKYRLISFGIFWFFLTLSIESSIIPISQNVIFEHRTYLPSVGFFIMMVSAVFYFTKEKYIKLLIGILIFMVLVMAVLTYQRNKVWKTELSLWTDCSMKSSNKVRPLFNMGNELSGLGNFKEALKYYDAAIRINPSFGDAYFNRGNARKKLNDIDGAISDYENAIRINPQKEDAYINLSNTRWKSYSDYKGAISMLTKAIEINPQNGRSYLNRGYIRFTLKDQGACEDLQRAMELGERQVMDFIQVNCAQKISNDARQR